MNTPPCSVDPPMFDSTDYWTHLSARRVCGTCPHVTECLLRAVEIAAEHGDTNSSHRGPDGTWGGLLWSAGHIITLPTLESEAA